MTKFLHGKKIYIPGKISAQYSESVSPEEMKSPGIGQLILNLTEKMKHDSHGKAKVFHYRAVVNITDLNLR